MKKSWTISLLAGSTILLSTAKAYAVCPVCTIAVGAGLVLAEEYGIDNTVSGVWIGGLMLSMIYWTIDYLKKKNWNFKFSWPATTIVYYLLLLPPLYWKHIIGSPLKTIWGVDKVIVGIIFGSFFFYFGVILYDFIKKSNGGHAWFPFQKVVMPVLSLCIISLIFYLITK
ncbi:MAG: hypothetical protein WCO23_00865 [bacterium]